jgi:hypothetical protein
MCVCPGGLGKRTHALTSAIVLWIVDMKAVDDLFEFRREYLMEEYLFLFGLIL